MKKFIKSHPWWRQASLLLEQRERGCLRRLRPYLRGRLSRRYMYLCGTGLLLLCFFLNYHIFFATSSKKSGSYVWWISLAEITQPRLPFSVPLGPKHSVSDLIYEGIHGSDVWQRLVYWDEDFVTAVGHNCLPEDIRTKLDIDPAPQSGRKHFTSSRASSTDSSSFSCVWYPAPGRGVQCCCSGQSLQTTTDAASDATTSTSTPLHCLPSAIIAGTQKSGTTALLAALLSTGAVHASARKEAHFFDRVQSKDTIAQFTTYVKAFPDFALLNGDDDTGAELSWSFKEIHAFSVVLQQPEELVARVARRITIDASPSYTLGLTTMQSIKQLLPAAKIIVLLRNPVDRAYSEYQMKARRVASQIRLDDPSHQQMLLQIADECTKQAALTAAENPRTPTFVYQSCVANKLVSIPGAAILRRSSQLSSLFACLTSRNRNDNATHFCFSPKVVTSVPYEKISTFSTVVQREWAQIQACSTSFRGALNASTVLTFHSTPSDDSVVHVPSRHNVPNWPGCAVSKHPSDAAYERRIVIDGTSRCFPRGSSSDISNDFFFRSVYVNQLIRVFSWFPKEQVFLLDSNTLQTQPDDVYEQMASFLHIPKADASNLHDESVAELIHTRFPTFHLTGWQLRSTYEPLADDLRNALLRKFQPYNAALFDVLGCEFDWK